MCTTCGCGDTELVPVELHEKILAGNDRAARHNREHFLEAGVLAPDAKTVTERVTLHLH